MKIIMITSTVLRNTPKRVQFIRTICRKDHDDDVILEDVNGNGVLTLNRPGALNALNLSMVCKLGQALNDWENKKNLVIVKGAGTQAFCAGGDVKVLACESMHGNTEFVQKYFRKEYPTIAQIDSYNIPYICLIDGVVMGNGVGLAVHDPFRVAAERTVFALPETKIGLFPDVGTSYFLPRLKGKLGLYLALTGQHLNGVDVLHAGIATHLCAGEDVPKMEKELLNCQNRDDVVQVLDKFKSKDICRFSLEPHMKKINHCFEAKSVEEILNNLQMDQSEWAVNTLSTLEKMCPTSLKVTFKQLKLGSQLTLLECLAMEYRLTYNMLRRQDFFEGVRAFLIDKDEKPAWSPSTLGDVSEELVDQQFVSLPEEQGFLKQKF